jgi:hypothetical protein
VADWSDLPEAQKCPGRDHRRWPCHFDSGHAGEHAFTDADEIRILRERLTAAEEEVAQLRNPGVLGELSIHEGESEQFFSSPIGLSYSALGLLEMHCEPSWADIAAKLAASFTKESHAEAEYDQILRRQGELLTATVNALKGPPPELTTWSVHDVAELAAGIRAEQVEFKRLYTECHYQHLELLKKIRGISTALDALSKPIETGRYAESGYNDHFNDGLQAAINYIDSLEGTT